MRMMIQCESYFLSTSFFNTCLSIGALLQESSGHQWPRGPLRASLLGQALLPPHLLSKIGVSTLWNDKNIDFTLPDKDVLLGHLPYGTVEYEWRRVGSGRTGKSLTYWWRTGETSAGETSVPQHVCLTLGICGPVALSSEITCYCWGLPVA